MRSLIFLTVDCLNDCGGADILKVIKFVFILLDLILFIVPVGLIIMVMIDFAKNVMAGKVDDMKKNANIAIKRIMYCVVLFLVPTIVNFVISLVSDAGVTAASCIELATADDTDFSLCDVDSEMLEEEKYSCYVCKTSDIYVWDNEKPADDFNGCTSGYRSDSARMTEDSCKVKSSSCWKCRDGSGYVFSVDRPSGVGYPYAGDTSYNYTSSVCAPGFEDEPVDNSYCSNTD